MNFFSGILPDGYWVEEKPSSEGDWELWYLSVAYDVDDLYLGWFTERGDKVHWYWNFRHEVYDNWKDALLTTVTRHKLGGLQDQERKVF
jgi:hypothetical protein